MMHWKARRLLASLPDGTLPWEVEVEVRAHAASCARCRGAMRDMALAEELVRQIPAALVPLEWSPRSYSRLAALARWQEDPELPGAEGWRVPVMSLVSAFTILVLAIGVGHYSPRYIHYGSPIELARMQVGLSGPPDSSLLPVTWR